MSSYSSFKKKHSNQVNQGKLNNYINSKKTETKCKNKEATKRLKVDITPKKLIEMNYCGSSGSKGFEVSAIISKTDSVKSLLSNKRSSKSIVKKNISVSKKNTDKNSL